MATEKKDKEIILHDDTETYGTGEEIGKVAPRDEMPDRLLTEDGVLLDLDHSTINHKPDVIDLCGRKVDLAEFGSHGEKFIVELYEQWLNAVQCDLISTYTERDTDLVNSYNILKHIPDQYASMKKRIVWRNTDPDLFNKTVGTVKWDQNTTFLEWMVFTLATLRWRYDEEIDSRRISHALHQDEINRVKELIGECISVVEQWLAMPESKKLLSV